MSGPWEIVCVPCWRHNVSMTLELPKTKWRFQDAECALCGRPTSYGLEAQTAAIATWVRP